MHERKIHYAPREGSIPRTEVRRIVSEVIQDRSENPLTSPTPLPTLRGQRSAL